MAFVVEDGSGVSLANAYASVAEVDAYLADRARSSENSWDDASTAAKQAAIIKATDFVEKRFCGRFGGVKLYPSLDYARTVLSLTQNAAEDETVVLGSTTFTFKAAPATAAEVDIGASTSASLVNLVNTVNAHSQEEVLLYLLPGDRVVVYAVTPGTGGNGLATTTTVTGATFSFATTRGGEDTGESQPLSFPRARLYDRAGRLVVGVPRRLKEAVAEYAVRAHAASLLPDPTLDASGRVVLSKREKVGPIEEATTYAAHGERQIVVYPAADALLTPYLTPGGGVFR